MITDKEVRFECVKMAMASNSGMDPVKLADLLFRYVQDGINQDRPTRAGPSAATDQALPPAGPVF